MNFLKDRPIAADLTAVLAGCLLPFAFAPYNFWGCAIIAAILVFEVTRCGSILRSASRFFAFYVAFMVVGFYWVYGAINLYFEISTSKAIPFFFIYIVGFNAMMVIPFGLAYAVYCRDSLKTSVLGFVALTVFSEWFRTWFYLSLPLGFWGYTFTDTPLSQLAMLTGIYGVTASAILGSLCLYIAIAYRQWVLIAVPIFIVGLSVSLTRVDFTVHERDIDVSLVQGNIYQLTKWLEDNQIPIQQHYRSMTQTEFGRDLIVWPEYAITSPKSETTNYLDELSKSAAESGSTLLLGIQDFTDEGRSQNSLIALGQSEGKLVKRRLVPFSEFIPLENLLRPVARFFELPDSYSDWGRYDQAPLMAGDNTLAGAICYEAGYPELLRRSVQDPDLGPDLIVVVSNDSMFESTTGQWWMLQTTQLRAIEMGRSIARATNNGITATIDHRGNIIEKLPQSQTGVLRAKVDVRQGSTPYQRFGDLPILVLMLALLVFSSRVWTKMDRT